MIAGEQAAVSVQAADAWGNAADSSTDRFWLEWSDTEAKAVQMVTSGAGMYAAEYVATTARNQSLGLTVWLYSAQVNFCYLLLLM